MIQMSLTDALLKLGIHELILTTEEAGQVTGLIYKENGKAYGRRTVSNWINAGLLVGARRLGRDWAVPISAIDPVEFAPPGPGRPTDTGVIEDAPLPLRFELIALIKGACDKVEMNLLEPACSVAFSICRFDRGLSISLPDLTSAGLSIIDWAVSEGIYDNSKGAPDWHALDQLLERTKSRK